MPNRKYSVIYADPPWDYGGKMQYEKPEIVIDGITKMFPEQSKIELFARKNYFGWDNWGLEIPNEKVKILSQAEIEAEQDLFELKLVNA